MIKNSDMKASSLRVGNKLQRTDGQILTVSIINLTDDILIKEVNGLFTFGYTANPIPLTDEWFEIFGFKKMLSFFIQIDDKKYLELAVNNDNATLQYYVYFRNKNKGDGDDFVLLRKDLKYVHELQNLFFALTGMDLVDLNKIEFKKEPYLTKK